ncbi:trypsin-like serine protease [Roseobacter sp.]|uniref:trypsin-like serine peptidase n=1 Tax=Roseobacter sp. TaxID=1907202 RepID=UPI00329A3ED3
MRRRCFSAILSAVLVTAPAAADPMPALGLAERQAWTAVGTINSAGYRTRASCTGTLIAPDLVVTAAHCAGGAPHFVAGWDQGSFAAHRKTVKATVHPNYDKALGNKRFIYDVAVLQLDTPIPTRTVQPVRLSGAKGLHIGDLTVLGYHRQRPHVLSGRTDCTRQDGADSRALILDCEVISGNSGGPVLATVGPDTVMVAVVTARLGGAQPMALAVPVDEWLIAQWDAAQARADTTAAH